MAIDPEIQAAINAIDRKIAKLQQAKELLLSEFSSNGAQPMNFGPPPPPPQFVVGSGHSAGPTGPSLWSASEVQIQPEDTQAKTTRKEQVKAFLVTQGPHLRREIVEKTGLPVGTVSFVLNDPMFRNNPHTGKWEVVPEEQMQQN